MIGGEAAEAALAGRRVPVDADQEPYDLGWVADWLYGNASLPPLPLPPREPAHPRHAPVHAEAPPHPDDAHPVPRRRSPARRRAKQLALL